MRISHVKYGIGQIVYHSKYNYRGVIVDVDSNFQGTDEWYHKQAKSLPPKDEPWYHVLVDGALHTTYVSEQHLEQDVSEEPITHPLVEIFFSDFSKGQYHSHQLIN